MSLLGDVESILHDAKGIFDPGGDPAAIHAAAAACRTLSEELSSMNSTLNGASEKLGQDWKGSASEGYQKAWSDISHGISEYSGGLPPVANKLDEVANYIQNADTQATHMKETALAAVGVGVALTIFSFGFSDEAGLAVAAGEIAAATSLEEGLGMFLDAAAAFLEQAVSSFIELAPQLAMQVGARMAMGGLMSVASEMLQKKLSGQNPLDLANYTSSDVSNVLLGAILTGVMGEAGAKIGPLNKFLNSDKFLLKIAAPGAYGAVGGGAGSAVGQIMIEGKPADLSTLKAIGESALISGGTGALMGLGAVGASAAAPKITSALPYNLFSTARGAHVTPAEPSSISTALNATGISKGDVLRGSIGIPSGAASYYINFASNNTATPIPANAPPAVAAQDIPVAHPAPLPPPPHIVKAGENLTEIAGGNAQLAQKIADLNHLSDPNVIQPGQKLKLPASG